MNSFLRSKTWRWMYRNLFSSTLNTSLTFIAVIFLAYYIPALLQWGIFDATISGDDASVCRQINENGDLVDGPGACWTFIKVRMPQFLFGLWYTSNSDEIWRPVLAFLLLAGLFGFLGSGRVDHRLRWKIAIASLIGYPLIAFALLHGSWLGLPVATTSDWGGLTLTLVLSVIGIIVALPIGIVLALARNSTLPVFKTIAVIWIELFRGTPLITILFIASVLLPLFFAEGVDLDKVLRAMVAITIFQSAYTAEAIRGGLAAIPKGQFEAAEALGLGYWRKMIFIVLPQSLKISIPAIVNSFIELYKDTSLVLIIGLLDLLNTVSISARSPEWKGYDAEGFIFAAAVYFIFCYGMSRYSQKLEQRFDTNLAGRRAQQE